jgi:hypothetical protein
MFGSADSNWLRAVSYLVVAGLCFVAAWREDGESEGSWPPFWVLTGALFGVMAIGRAGDVADAVTNALRTRAVAGGWYASRRKVQAVVVGGLGLIWFVAVMVACARVPARRRRYLPMIVVVLTLGLYAAIRVVSLHQIDAILHNRHIAGVRYGTIIEYALLVLAGACTFWTPRQRDRLAAGHEAPVADDLVR